MPAVAWHGLWFDSRIMHCGDVRGSAVEVSDDGARWREVARGGLPSIFEPQEIRFGAAVTAAPLHFTAPAGFAVDNFTAPAELAVLDAGPKLAGRGSDDDGISPGPQHHRRGRRRSGGSRTGWSRVASAFMIRPCAAR